MSVSGGNEENMKEMGARIVVVCGSLLLAVGLASCGKKTVDPPKMQESGEESAAQEEQAQQEETAMQSEAEEENAARDGQLAGGSSGTINYEVEYEEKRYEAEDGTAIFEVKLAYPVLQGEEEGVQAINSFFRDWRTKRLVEYESDENSTRQTALEVYRESKDSGWPGPWGEQYAVSVVKTWNGYVSVLMDAYLYEGGSHGMPWKEGYAFNLADGKRAQISEVTGKTGGEWDKILRAGFSKVVSMGEEGEYYEDALEILKERDMQDVGFYFTDTGIHFYLPPYEIGPYSTGYVEMEVPFSELERDTPIL